MDLYVSGTSVAAGYGSRSDSKNYPEDSWPSILAEMLQVDNLAKDVMPTKPMALSMYDTVNYITEYEKTNNPEDLFVIVEILPPQYRDLGFFRENDSIVYPTFLQQQFDDNGNKILINQYTSQSSIRPDIDTLSELNVLELQKKVSKFIASYTANHVQYCIEFAESMFPFIEFLRARKVKYLMYWVYESDKQCEIAYKNHNPELFEYYFDRRLIHAEFLSALSFTSKNNMLSAFDLHPTKKGHTLIASSLKEYIEKNHILSDIL